MAANQDDIAFRSQEYASQVNRDVEPARQRLHNAQQGFVQSAATGMEMARQGRQDAARNALAQQELMQRQQQIAMEKTRDAGALALQQARQRQAEYELAFTKEIHNTKAIEAQRRLITTQADMADLQKRKLEQDLQGEWPKGITVEEMDYMVSKGRKWDFRTRGWMDATPEEMAAAEKRSAAGIARERIAAQNAAEDRKLKQGQQALDQRRVGDQLEAIRLRLGETKNIRDKATREAAIESLTKELEAVSQGLQSGEAQQQEEPEPQAQTTGGEFYRDMLRSIPKAGK